MYDDLQYTITRTTKVASMNAGKKSSSWHTQWDEAALNSRLWPWGV